MKLTRDLRWLHRKGKGADRAEQDVADAVLEVVDRYRLVSGGNRIVNDVGPSGDDFGHTAGAQQWTPGRRRSSGTGSGKLDVEGNAAIITGQDHALMTHVGQDQITTDVLAEKRLRPEVRHLHGIGRTGRHGIRAIGGFDFDQDRLVAGKLGHLLSLSRRCCGRRGLVVWVAAPVPLPAGSCRSGSACRLFSGGRSRRIGDAS